MLFHELAIFKCAGVDIILGKDIDNYSSKETSTTYKAKAAGCDDFFFVVNLVVCEI